MSIQAKNTSPPPSIDLEEDADTMEVITYDSWPPERSEEDEKAHIESLRVYGLLLGFSVKNDDPKIGTTAALAPITLFPSLFPRSTFETAKSVQKDYNLLYARVASDTKWLEESIAKVAVIDDFVKNLWQIHLDLRECGYTHKHTLGLFRSDYMIHVDKSSTSPKPTLKQVEFNTIASSFGGLATQATKIHKHLYESTLLHPSISESQPPPNTAAEDLANGLKAAHTAYISSFPTSSHPRCILFIVQDGEKNAFDQYHLALPLSTSGIPVHRLPFPQILQHTSLLDDGTLFYTQPHHPHLTFEVSTIYYRAGYAPTEYDSPESWEARAHLEKSRAIKCPTVLLQLAGLKKVQQVLATPSSPHLETFLPNDSAAQEKIRETFAPMYPMDSSPAGLEGRKLALDENTARRFVLKPQREGGGNNIYREDIPAFLKGMEEEKWEAYVLMEMIEAPEKQRNVILRGGEVRRGGVICELGVYGVVLWENGKGEEGINVLVNEQAGYLLRTKGDDSLEGGVAAGFGALDSVLLVGDESL